MTTVAKHQQGQHDQKRHGKKRPGYSGDSARSIDYWRPDLARGGRDKQLEGVSIVGELLHYPGMYLLEPDIEDSGGLGSTIRNATSSLRGWNQTQDPERPHERSYLIGTDGRVLAHMLGSANQTPAAPRKRFSIANMTLMHNHPSNTSFSVQDISLLGGSGLRQIFAVDNDRLFRMGRRRRLTDGKRPVHDAMPRVRKYQDEQIELIKAGKLTTEQAYRNHPHPVWKQLSEEKPDLYDYNWVDLSQRASGSMKKMHKAHKPQNDPVKVVVRDGMSYTEQGGLLVDDSDVPDYDAVSSGSDDEPPLAKHLQGHHDQRTHGRRGQNLAGLAHSAKFVAPSFLAEGVGDWLAQHGYDDPFPGTDYAGVRQDHARQMAIADAYDALPGFQRGALASYAAMGRDTEAQYRFLTDKLGVRMEVTDTDPYPNVQAMVSDVGANKRLRVLSTARTGGHPFFTDEQNDKFRFVHDAFGHAATGRGFDRHGEEAAWMSHVRMYSPQARAAMTSETRGQNASLIKNGDFPEQKIALLPDSFHKRTGMAYMAAQVHSLGIDPSRAIEIAKHLQGQHDQKRHGRKGPKRLRNALRTQGGFSYQPLVGTSPDGGFAVAILPKAERVFDGIPSAEDIRGFVKENRGRVRNQRLHLGGWYDTESDQTYLDVSVVVEDEDQAHRIGRKFDQIAIFDLDKGAEHNVEDRPRQRSGYERSGVGKRGRAQQADQVPGADGRPRSRGGPRRLGKAARELEVERIDEDRRQVFGWASVAKIGDVEVVDSQGDMIDIEDLEKAAYDFVLRSRDGGDMHLNRGVSTLIESVVFTPEKIAKMGLEPDALPQAWWVGFQVTDEATWSLIKAGRRKAFSIGGRGYREPVAKHQQGGHDQKKHGRKGSGMPAGAIETPAGMAQFSPKVQHAILKTVEKRIGEDGAPLNPEQVRAHLGSLWDESYSNNRSEFHAAKPWYRDANEFAQSMAAIHDTTPEGAVGVLAALSPQTGWGTNKEMGHSLMAVLRADPKVRGRRLSDHSPDEVGRFLTLLGHDYGAGEQSLFAQSSDNVAKATRLYRGESADTVLGNGPKVRSFFNNLLHPDKATSWTDDTHMRRIHLQDPKISNQDRRFTRIFGSTPTVKGEGYNRSWGIYPYIAEQASSEASRRGVLPHELQAVTWTRWRAKHGQKGGDAARAYLTEKELIDSLRRADRRAMNL